MTGFKFEGYQNCLDVLHTAAREHSLRLDNVEVSGGVEIESRTKVLRFTVDLINGEGFAIERTVTDDTRVYATQDFEDAVDIHMRLAADKPLAATPATE